MNHQFIPSSSDESKCGNFVGNRLCHHPFIAHGKEAECDHCDYVGVVESDANNDLACASCLNLVVKKEIINSNHGPIGISEVLRKSRETDYSVELVSDIFNLETTAITEIVNAIRADETITNKPNAIAGAMYDRIRHFQKVIFERSDENKKDYSRQRAYQTELNKIANELRDEEREKYRLIDINYKPRPPKEEIKVKKVSLKKKIDKTALREAAKELGIGEFVIQALCVSQNLSVEDAKIKIKVNMEKARLASST